MAYSEDRFQAVLARITAIEEHLNDLTVALNKVATLNQVQAVNVLLQEYLDRVLNEVQALETRVAAVENEPVP